MKGREELRLDALRMIKTALTKHKIDTMKALDEQSELQILNMLVVAVAIFLLAILAQRIATSIVLWRQTQVLQAEVDAQRVEMDRLEKRKRYVQTLERLAAEGIRVQPDREAGWLEYRAQREEWESKLRRLALYLGYDWEEVTGDRDLEYAADEKKEEPRATTLG